MTLKLRRSLWLWAGALALALLAIVPLTKGLRAAAMLAIACSVILAWSRAGRRAACQSECLSPADAASLPPAAYRKPVVLVCGDGLVGLFGAVAVERLDLRVSEQGCYLRVSDLGQLSTLAQGLLILRPDWVGQLSVMFVVNPGEHADSTELAGRVRTLCHQMTVIRKRGVTLPLLLVSYLRAARGVGTWFSWEGGQTSPNALEAGACISLTEWQQQATGSVLHATRLQTAVQLNSFVDWLGGEVLRHFTPPDSHSSFGMASSCAITLVPLLPQAVVGNLWRQWLLDKVALDDANQALASAGTALPFPDPVLHLVAVNNRKPPARRASVVALWLFALTGFLALASSGWQNTLLLRQVSDDLRRYYAISQSHRSDGAANVLREEAMAVLRQQAKRLDDYYRHGEPLALGLGLYQGERLRAPLLAAIAGHQQAPVPATHPKPVRLDSLSLFNRGSAQLKADSTKVLINALVDIKAQPGWLIVIAGHTDATGNPAHNLQLSRARAAAVRDWMQRMGNISDSCFAVQGFGASQPIASNNTETGRTANRRVDIRLVPEVGACARSTAVTDRKPLSQPATFNN